MYHWRKHHKDEPIIAVKAGKYADSYRWAQPKSLVDWSNCRTFFGILQPFMGLPHERALIEHAKKQLTAGKKVPYEFTQFGAIAAREMFIDKIRIPTRLVAPTTWEKEQYTNAYLHEEIYTQPASEKPVEKEQPAADEFTIALDVLTQSKPFRVDDGKRSYNGSNSGSPAQALTPPRVVLDYSKSPKL